MLEKWETPRVTIQEFEPNEYVAACWGVKCNVDWSNNYEMRQGDYNNGVTHSWDHCGNSSNQVIFDDNNDGTADRMIETKTDGLGDLTCNIFWDEKFTYPRNVSTVEIGDEIYWTTTASDGRTWNHKGTVFATAEGHPNRS
ncbi:hypothetical protein [uncultured Thomasclavelia sp.]|uniref:hypothetical protein n=1 Tax=uncultured Thomasclavelia sp. TaxID=3025759 RepID=UPI00260CAB1F|nr:hypothetical protein [uncultured Thomasclavelia sp.]